jgi:acetyl esterase/lipase
MTTMIRVSVAAVAVLIVARLPAQEQRVEVHVEPDLVYGKAGDMDLKLDLAMPQDGEGPFPALVCIHGSEWWQTGSRKDLARTISELAAHGYVAVSVEYRLAPAAKFPAAIEDCKAAVRWLRANATRYRINPDRIGAIGFSAGAHLACLLGTTDASAGLEGAGGNPEQSSRVQAVVSFFGPTDFTKKTWSKEAEEALLVPFFGAPFDGKPELYRQASPITHASADDPPFLFFHGSADPCVALRHSKALAARLQAVGVPAAVIELQGEGHGWKGPRLLQSIEQMQAFLDGQLKK